MQRCIPSPCNVFLVLLYFFHAFCGLNALFGLSCLKALHVLFIFFTLGYFSRFDSLRAFLDSSAGKQPLLRHSPWLSPWDRRHWVNPVFLSDGQEKTDGNQVWVSRRNNGCGSTERWPKGAPCVGLAGGPGVGQKWADQGE